MKSGKPTKKKAKQAGSSSANQQSISTETGLAAVEKIAQVADKEDIEYAIAGGIAMHLFGFTRATTDVNMIASKLLPLSAKAPLTIGGETYEIDLDKRKVEVDWIVRNDERAFLYQAALEDAEETQAGWPIISPEWLVILKHFAARGKDEMDLLWLLRQDDLVDRQRLMEIVKQMFGRFAFAVEQEMEHWFLQADLMRAKDEKSDRDFRRVILDGRNFITTSNIQAKTRRKVNLLMNNKRLQQVKIETPCQANWDEMAGTEKRRFCEQCQLHVHNFSAMSEREILVLLSKSEERVCGRIQQTLPEYLLRTGFKRSIRRGLNYFVSGLKIGVAALIGFVGFPSDVNAQAAKTGIQKDAEQSIAQPAKRKRLSKKKFTRPLRITTIGVLAPTTMEPHHPVNPTLVVSPPPSLRFPTRQEKEEEPPPPKRPDGNYSGFQLSATCAFRGGTGSEPESTGNGV